MFIDNLLLSTRLSITTFLAFISLAQFYLFISKGSSPRFTLNKPHNKMSLLIIIFIVIRSKNFLLVICGISILEFKGLQIN